MLEREEKSHPQGKVKKGQALHRKKLEKWVIHKNVCTYQEKRVERWKKSDR